MKYFLLTLVAVLGISFTACNDDETNMSRKVLASTDVLVYEVSPEGPQIIMVTSDGDWEVEAPDWISVSPMSGHAGQTEVEISVDLNADELGPENPRKANILFKGRNLESIATVLIRQDGDKFRDPVDYTIEALTDVPDETMVRLPGMVVCSMTSKGFMVSDGTSYMYVKEPIREVSIGQKINVHGEKHTDSNKMVYVLGESISDAGAGSIPEMKPLDINNTLDEINLGSYVPVTVSGNFDGSSITVGENVNKVYLSDAHESLGVGKLGGHIISVTGYYNGAASPVVNVIPSQIEDLGVNEVVYFFEDFEWLGPWALLGKNGNGDPKAGDTIGSNNESAESPQISAKGMLVDGITAETALLDKGYSFYRVTPTSDDAGECIYLNSNYLKFGKTGYQAGICFPSIDVPDGEKVIMEFDWSVQRKGASNGGTFDPVTLYIIVDNGGNEVEFEIPTHTFAANDPFKWIHVSLDLSSMKIDKNTKISIKQREWKVKTANRWFLDNIKFKQAED